MKLLDDDGLTEKLVDLLIDYDKYTKHNQPIVWNVRKKEFVDFMKKQQQAYGKALIGKMDNHSQKCFVYRKSTQNSSICICTAKQRNQLRMEQHEFNRTGEMGDE